MGCSLSREELREEEQSIIMEEEQLDLSKSSCVQIDLTIRKYSREWVINAKQWTIIQNELAITAKNTPKATKLEAFYALFADSKGKINGKQVNLLGIICGNGNPTTKSRLIFEIYDQDLIGKISRKDAEDLFKELFEITLIKIPALLPEQNEFQAPNQKIMQYLNNARESKKAAKAKFIMIILDNQESIDKNSFVLKFDSGEYGRLLTTVGFRKFVSSAKGNGIKNT
jgi:hypothetical protein